MIKWSEQFTEAAIKAGARLVVDDGTQGDTWQDTAVADERKRGDGQVWYVVQTSTLTPERAKWQEVTADAPARGWTARIAP